MFERYTESARRVLFFARYEAAQLASPAIGTEHLLLGLVRLGKGVSARCMAAFHVSFDDIRHDVAQVTATRGSTTPPNDIPFTADMKRVLEYAAEEADRLVHDDIEPQHLLLGLLREERCVAASILTARGLTLEGARQHVRINPITTAALGERLRDERDLLEIQQALARAWLERDRAAIEQVLAREWSVTQPDGSILTRAMVLGPLFENLRLDVNTVDEVSVTVAGSAAVVRGRTVASGTLDGVPVSTRIRFTDVF